MKKSVKNELAGMMETLEALQSRVEEIHNDEEEAWEAHSESWQESERGEAAYDVIDNLDSLMQSIEEARDALEEVLNA